MKKILLFAFAVAVLVLVSGVVVGEGKETVKPSDAGAAVKSSIRPKIRDRGARDSSRRVQSREMMAMRKTERMKADIKRATKIHKEFAAELNAIKKLAEKEGAPKTAAKIQELIDKDKKKVETKVANMKKRMEEYMKRMQDSRPGGGKGFIQGQRPDGGRGGPPSRGPGFGGSKQLQESVEEKGKAEKK